MMVHSYPLLISLYKGEGVKSALDYIINSPLSSLTPKERKENAAWKKNTKYRSRVAFWENNH